MLLQSNMVKRLTASGGGELEAKTGESLRVKRIECIPSTNDGYLTISVDRVTLAYYRVKGKSGNHLSTMLTAYLKRNLMQFLTDAGINVSIPIAEGQTLTVSRYAEAGNVILIYDRYSAGDVKASDPNGTESNIYTFLQYAKIGSTPDASGDFQIDTALTPAEFPDFPCGKVVPARHTIELLGIVGSPFVQGIAGPHSLATQFLKLVKDREVLFDTDRNGIPFNGEDAAATAVAYASNFSLIGPCTEVLLNTNAICNGDPLMFEPALVFEAGQELLAYLTLLETNVSVWVDDTDDQAFILRVRRT
jgi:hypothetical protein